MLSKPTSNHLRCIGTSQVATGTGRAFGHGFCEATPTQRARSLSNRVLPTRVVCHLRLLRSFARQGSVGSHEGTGTSLGALRQWPTRADHSTTPRQFREVTSTGPGAVAALDRWIAWAQRCRIAQFVRLARRIREYRSAIVVTIEHGLTNALVESFNTKIRLITRRAFGFHNVNALIALARLTLSGQRPKPPT